MLQAWRYQFVVLLLAACSRSEIVTLARPTDEGSVSSSDSGAGGTGAPGGAPGRDAGGAPDPKQEIVISSDALDETEVGVDYSAALRVTGGEPPYVWSVDRTRLPPAMSLANDGRLGALLAGLAERAGTFDFEVTVSDARGRSTARMFTLRVRPRPWIAYRTRLEVGSELGVAETRSSGEGIRVQGLGEVTSFLWSPRGDALLVQSRLPKLDSQIFLVDLAGLGPSRALDAGALVASSETLVDAAWAPNASGFVYRVGPRGTFDSNRAYWVPIADGRPSPSVLIFESATGFWGHPQFSPDGSKVICRGQIFSSSVEIASVDLGGAEPTTAARAGAPLVADGNVSAWSFSPDSRWLLYEADAEIDNVFELYALSTRSTGFGPPIKLNPPLAPNRDVGTAVPGEELDWMPPTWAPTGARIAFVADVEVDGRLDLYVVDLDGEMPSVARRVSHPSPSGRIDSFAWVDSSHIVYSFAPDGGMPPWELWLADAVGQVAARRLDGKGIGGGRLSRVVRAPRRRGFVLMLSGSFVLRPSVHFGTLDETGDARLRFLYEIGGGNSHSPEFSPPGTYLLAPGDLEGAGTARLHGIDLSGPEPGPPTLLGPDERLVCPPNRSECGGLWRSDGLAAAHVVESGKLIVTEFVGTVPAAPREVRDPKSAPIDSLAWPP